MERKVGLVFAGGAADLDGLAVEAGLMEEGMGEEYGEGWSEKAGVLVRGLLEMRLRDPGGFDLLCLKALFPDATHARLAALAKGLGGVVGSRSRCCEKLGELAREFPEVRGVFRFDRRGGWQGGVKAGTLAEELEALRGEWPGVSASGENGLYWMLAERHGIAGRDGRPSWVAVKMRIRRFLREKRRGTLAGSCSRVVGRKDWK